ncbi:MAG: hypothetical protein ACXVH5_05705 [Ilumatobacteraceae bacterium]
MTELSPLVFDYASRSFAAAARQSLSQTAIDAPVGVVVPAWFAITDRHQLVTYLDHGGQRPVGLVSSALAGAYGRYVGRTGRRSRAPVLILDVRLGWSAGLVRFEPARLAEVAAWGIAPHEVAGRLDDGVICRWFVEHLFTATSAIVGAQSIWAVVVIDDAGGRAAMVSEAVARCAHPLARCPVHIERSTEVASGAASFFALGDDPPRSTGALAHALTVRADGDPERLAMHVVAAEHALFPSSTRQLFELGPDDGAPLHFDIYEQHGSAPGEPAIDHRLVVRSNLVRERGYDQQMMVTFELGANGLLSVGPVKAWRLDWQPGSLSLESAG